LVGRSRHGLAPLGALASAVFGRRTGACDESHTPSSHALALTFRERPEQVARSSVQSKTTHIQPRTAFHGVCRPTTLEETGSDQHRACLTRLCNAYRLSRPLDALLRLQPFPPCFMRVTPLGFCLQRFSLSGSEESLTTSIPSMPFIVAPPKPASRFRLRSAATPRIDASGQSVPASTVLPEERRPILS
jgi:hypothetical protein